MVCMSLRVVVSLYRSGDVILPINLLGNEIKSFLWEAITVVSPFHCVLHQTAAIWLVEKVSNFSWFWTVFNWCFWLSKFKKELWIRNVRFLSKPAESFYLFVRDIHYTDLVLLIECDKWWHSYIPGFSPEITLEGGGGGENRSLSIKTVAYFSVVLPAVF